MREDREWDLLVAQILFLPKGRRGGGEENHIRLVFVRKRDRFPFPFLSFPVTELDARTEGQGGREGCESMIKRLVMIASLSPVTGEDTTTTEG